LDPDPAFHFDADPDPALKYPKSMRIRIRKIELPAAYIDEKNLTTKM
jgi:hypothetical protein